MTENNEWKFWAMINEKDVYIDWRQPQNIRGAPLKLESPDSEHQSWGHHQPWHWISVILQLSPDQNQIITQQPDYLKKIYFNASGPKNIILVSIWWKTLLGEAELAMEKTPESAWLAGESLLFVSRGDSEERGDWITWSGWWAMLFKWLWGYICTGAVIVWFRTQM